MCFHAIKSSFKVYITLIVYAGICLKDGQEHEQVTFSCLVQHQYSSIRLCLCQRAWHLLMSIWNGLPASQQALKLKNTHCCSIPVFPIMSVSKFLLALQLTEYTFTLTCIKRICWNVVVISYIIKFLAWN